MVNKPHASRSHKPGSKKPAASASTINGEDTSYIVFGNEKPKKGKQAAPEPPASTAKGKGTDASAAGAQPEAEKKPDTRTLIAGSSWTGKLPQTLFNEHCQKQRWERDPNIPSTGLQEGSPERSYCVKSQRRARSLCCRPSHHPRTTIKIMACSRVPWKRGILRPHMLCSESAT